MPSLPPAESPLQMGATPRSASLVEDQIQLLKRIRTSYKRELRRLRIDWIDDTPPSDKAESPKAAHARRREQVRKAQRKHRERKETYIKSLEQQILRLRNRTALATEEKQALVTENHTLKELLRQYDIPIPSNDAAAGAAATSFGPTASVSLREAPEGTRNLQVSMPDASPVASAQPDSSSPEYIDVDPTPGFNPSQHLTGPTGRPGGSPGRPPAFRTRYPSDSVEIQPVQSAGGDPSGKNLPPLPATNHPRQPHPQGLDAAQVGVDFVLALETPCLNHARGGIGCDASFGHALTFGAPLLTPAPQPLQPSSSWTVPAVEIEQLLNLSSQLSLVGELTPVQAWSRIRSHAKFERLHHGHLDNLRRALLQEVQCYGFGAVMNQSAVENIVHQCFYGL